MFFFPFSPSSSSFFEESGLNARFSLVLFSFVVVLCQPGFVQNSPWCPQEALLHFPPGEHPQGWTLYKDIMV